MSPAGFVVTGSCCAPPPAAEGVCPFSQASLPRGSWAGSCSDAAMNATECTLSATCNGPGGLKRTSIDLNKCMAAELGNNKGSLIISACRECRPKGSA